MHHLYVESYIFEYIYQIFQKNWVIAFLQASFLVLVLGSELLLSHEENQESANQEGTASIKNFIS